MRDPPRLQGAHLLPGVAGQLVGDLLVGEGVQGPAAQVLVHEHHRVRAQLGGGDQLLRVRPGRDGGVREERLLLQGLPQRLQAAAGGDAAQGEPAPDPVEEALGLLLPVDDGDVERRTVLQGDVVAPAAVTGLGRLGALGPLGAHRADRLEADAAQPGEEVLPGGAHVGGADGVEGAVGHAPADQHGEDDREGGGVAVDEHGERVEQQDHPQRDAPVGSAGHAHRGHVRDHGREVAVHGVGEGPAARGTGQGVLDGAGGGLGHPQVGGQGDAVREDGGEHAVGDAQPVAFDQPLDGEGDGEQQHRDAGDQRRDLDQQVRRLAGALADVLLEADGGAVGEGGDAEQDGDAEDADEEAYKVGGPVHAGGEQRFVDLDPVGLGRGVAVRGLRVLVAAGGAVGGAVIGAAVVVGAGGTAGRQARREVLGAVLRAGGGAVVRARAIVPRRAFRRAHTLLLRRHIRLFLITYHQSPPGRWWHGPRGRRGIRVRAGPEPQLPPTGGRRTAPCAE